MKRWLTASLAVVVAVFEPFDVLGAQAAEAAGWLMRLHDGRPA